MIGYDNKKKKLGNAFGFSALVFLTATKTRRKRKRRNKKQIYSVKIGPTSICARQTRRMGLVNGYLHFVTSLCNLSGVCC